MAWNLIKPGVNIYPEAQFELLRLTIEQQEGGGTVTRRSIRWARSKEFFIEVHFSKDGGVRRDPKEFFFNIKQIERHGVVLSPKPQDSWQEEITLGTKPREDYIEFGVILTSMHRIA